MGELAAAFESTLTTTIGDRAEELLKQLFDISLTAEKEIDRVRAIEVLFRISREERYLILKEAEIKRRFAKTAQEIAEGDSDARGRAQAVLRKMLENGDLPKEIAQAYEGKV